MAQPVQPGVASSAAPRVVNGSISGVAAQLAGNAATAALIAHGMDPGSATLVGTAAGGAASGALASIAKAARDGSDALPDVTPMPGEKPLGIFARIFAQPFKVLLGILGTLGMLALMLGANVAGAANDYDGDGVADSSDNCPTLSNAGQADADGDGVGDACDNCVNVSNPRAASNYLYTHAGAHLTGDQLDDDQDGYGNACQTVFHAGESKIVAEFDMLSYSAANSPPHYGDTDCGCAGFCGFSGMACKLLDLNGDGIIENTYGTSYGQSGHEDFDRLFFIACGETDCSGSLGYPFGPFNDSAVLNGTKAAAAPITLPVCFDGQDNDGDAAGKFDWFGKDGGGDPSCPTPDWSLGECRRPNCAPASNATGVGLSSISPAVAAWPGNYKTAGTGGCPSGNTISSSGVYSYCSFSNGLLVTAQNVTCYGCRVQASGDSSVAIKVTASNSNFRFVYGLVEPPCVAAGTCNAAGPWSRLTGYQFAMCPGNGQCSSAAPWTLERSTLHGWGNAVNLDNSGCNSTHPCTVRGVTMEYPRDDANEPGGTNNDHTDGVACTSGGSCPGNYVTMTGDTFLGLIKHVGGSTSSANTNAVGFQGPNGTYDHEILSRSYLSGWNTVIDLRSTNTNSALVNNWFGTEWQPLNAPTGFLNATSSNIWAGNKWNVDSNGTWSYPTASDDGKFWWPSDTNTSAKHATDFNGNVQIPYPEPQCNDGIDNDGDGNIDYPWDSGCTDAWDTSE